MNQSSQAFFELISGIKQKLLERGANTIATLPKLFRSLQSYDNKSRVNVNEFLSVMSQFGLDLRKEEVVTLVKSLNKDSSSQVDSINVDDFLFSIRGKPNDERQAVIDLVYYKFDKNKTGYAEATELRKVFNCIKHPRYLMGEYTEDQIFYLFLQNFSNNISGTVTKKEWDDYYAGVSITVDDDSHFIKLIKNQFKVE